MNLLQWDPVGSQKGGLQKKMGWNLFVQLGHLISQCPNPTIAILGTAQEGLLENNRSISICSTEIAVFGGMSHIFQQESGRYLEIHQSTYFH